MKHFKIGITAIIAVLAMSFTVASHHGALKATVKPLTVSHCYSFSYYNSSCTIVAPSTCDGTIVGRPVTTLVDQSSNAACNTGTNTFCCARLKVATSRVCGQPQVSFTDFQGNSQVNQFANIQAIFCKP